jgi:hypothetical protein
MNSTLVNRRVSSRPSADSGACGELVEPAREDKLQDGKAGRAARLYYGICLFALFVVASAAAFSSFYEKWHFREPGVRGVDIGAEFGQMIDGTARRPYVYRQLLPYSANLLVRIMPIEAISRRLPARAKDRVKAAFDLQSKAFPVQYLIVYAETYLSALLAIFALYLVCRQSNLPPVVAVFTPVVFMLLFPLLGIKGGYFFDFPELLFLAAAVWVALRFDWWFLIPVAALGTWNKESFLLFVFTLYPLLRRRHSRLTSQVSVAVLVAVCAAVYVPIRMHFAHNPGGTVEWHFKEQVEFYLHPFTMDTWIDRTYDLMFPALSGPIPTLILIWTVWRAWRHLPLWLKRHTLIAAVINVPLYLLFCQPGEFRDLSMLYISLLLIIAANLQMWMRSTAQADANLAITE